jgi:hypothetical protein
MLSLLRLMWNFWVNPNRFWASACVRPQSLPSKSFPIHNSSLHSLDTNSIVKWPTKETSYADINSVADFRLSCQTILARHWAGSPYTCILKRPFIKCNEGRMGSIAFLASVAWANLPINPGLQIVTNSIFTPRSRPNCRTLPTAEGLSELDVTWLTLRGPFILVNT